MLFCWPGIILQQYCLHMVLFNSGTAQLRNWSLLFILLFYFPLPSMATELGIATQIWEDMSINEDRTEKGGNGEKRWDLDQIFSPIGSSPRRIAIFVTS